jgi:transcriptional regulator with XRE-family HTH domain
MMLPDLERARLADGLSQRQLASRLKISQPYLSRLVSKKVPLTGKMRRKIKLYLDRRGQFGQDQAQWLARIADAAERSPAFRGLVEAALELVIHNDT